MRAPTLEMVRESTTPDTVGYSSAPTVKLVTASTLRRRASQPGRTGSVQAKPPPPSPASAISGMAKDSENSTRPPASRSPIVHGPSDSGSDGAASTTNAGSRRAPVESAPPHSLLLRRVGRSSAFLRGTWAPRDENGPCPQATNEQQRSADQKRLPRRDYRRTWISPFRRSGGSSGDRTSVPPFGKCLPRRVQELPRGLGASDGPCARPWLSQGSRRPPARVPPSAARNGVGRGQHCPTR